MNIELFVEIMFGFCLLGAICNFLAIKFNDGRLPVQRRKNFSENRKVLLSLTSISITGIIIFVTQGFISKFFQIIGLA